MKPRREKKTIFHSSQLRGRSRGRPMQRQLKTIWREQISASYFWGACKSFPRTCTEHLRGKRLCQSTVSIHSTPFRTYLFELYMEMSFLVPVPLTVDTETFLI